MSTSKKDQQRDQLTASLRSRREESAPNSAPRAPRVKPVRITVDLEPALHRRLKLWAVEADATSLAEVVRVLVDRLDDDPKLAKTVKATLAQRRMQ